MTAVADFTGGEGVEAREVRRVAAASAVGTTVEYYDYFVYASAAASVFGPQFFTALSPASATLAGLASFGVGYVTRPIGGVLAGHLGDRVGRKAVLVASLVLMGAGTVAVGLLPTYAQIGVWAPALLVALRLIQGVGVGAEWGGAALMAVEHAPPERRGRYGASCQIGVPGGLVLAQIAFLALTGVLDARQFATWGRRVPFLAGAVLVVIGLVVRLGVAESPVFAALRSAGARSAAPLREAVRERGGTIALAATTFLAHVTIANIFLAYLVTYGVTELGLPRGPMTVAVLIGALAFLLTVPFAGAWSDRIGRRRLYLGGSVLLVVWSAVFFALVDTRAPAAVAIAVAVLGVALGSTNGAQSALFCELFAPRHRFSGASTAFALAAALGGGTGPVAAAALQQWAGSAAITVLMVGVSVVSLAAVLALPETAPGPRGRRALAR